MSRFSELKIRAVHKVSPIMGSMSIGRRRRTAETATGRNHWLKDSPTPSIPILRLPFRLKTSIVCGRNPGVGKPRIIRSMKGDRRPVACCNCVRVLVAPHVSGR